MGRIVGTENRVGLVAIRVPLKSVRKQRSVVLGLLENDKIKMEWLNLQ
jgi:hypothetical protein